ncbi:hypothetical protein CWB99_02355 [Pseudoalteromonas rubra]|uniref:Lipocalin-like domain-containing protein n=1 Tax=Pseudoalteromonas rubra TaxID=43658 RepID=A0A5S3WSL5_9GAMM|nr:hypothetical protein [Pseudoalteromonas rubra]TMP29249.1 hypothetical protein CWC00_19225 [Pseudoalteromonas rubra]TMP32067.1 hypothetical protein CWB99_02355 [Pseudoalteromonas rubra]
MKIKIGFFIFGFLSCLCLLAGTLFVTLIQDKNTPAIGVIEFDMSSNAYQDEDTCPNIAYDALVGTWLGEKEIQETGTIRRWTNTRTADGHYNIKFTSYRDGEVVDERTESGLWSYSGCLYTVIVKKVDSDPVLYQEVYRVHEVTDSMMKYTNFRTANEFKLLKTR